MIRRVSGLAPARDATLVARRCYTDYDHHKYPVLYQIVYGLPAMYLVIWFTMFFAGSAMVKRSEWKKDIMRSWRRRKGTGYKWGNDFGPEIKNAFKNIPTGTA